MTISCFTSFSFTYLAKARVLAETLKEHNPRWQIIALITDHAPKGFQFDPHSEPFDRVVFYKDLDIPDAAAWAFQHNVIELCTGVKGPFLHQLLEEGADKVVYLDPDVAVFETLAPLEEMLESHSIVITPHQLTPESESQAVQDNELCALNFGVYNLGFLAVRNDTEGRKLGAWWQDRLIEYCIDERHRGLFVDQKWFDLVPAIFDRVLILRDPGYNVASWNLSNRTLTIGHDGTIRVNDSPLRFFHFTKLGPIGDMMTSRYARDNLAVYEIWEWYKRRVSACTSPEIPEGYWAFATFEDGTGITDQMRQLYRARKDLQQMFPSPFAGGEESFSKWFERQNG